MAKFKPYQAGQPHLLPPSLEDYVPKGHLARVVYEAVERLDTRAIEEKYSEKGQHTYHPKVLLKLLFYGYATGVRSGRKIATRCESDTAYMYLGETYQPDFRTINDFRKNHLREIENSFVEIVRLCQELGMVKAGSISIDGTKMRANAAARRSRTKEGYEKWEKKIEEQIRGMLREAEETDAAEDREYGDTRGDEIPKELHEKEQLRKKIQEAYQRIQHEKEKRNLTDGDSRFMKDGQGKIKPGYNCQIAVTDAQVIVAADVVMEPNDRKQLMPMLHHAQETTGEKVTEVLADSGYANYDTYEALEQEEITGYIPDQYFAQKNHGVYDAPDKRYHRENFRYDAAQDVYWCPEGKVLRLYKERDSDDGVVKRKQWIYKGSACGTCPKRAQCTTARYRTLAREKREECQERMRVRLVSAEGKQRYGKRLFTVEPIFGHLKKNLGYRDFLLRSIEKVRGEFKLMCIGYNLMKYWHRKVAMAAG